MIKGGKVGDVYVKAISVLSCVLCYKQQNRLFKNRLGQIKFLSSIYDDHRTNTVRDTLTRVNLRSVGEGGRYQPPVNKG